MLEIVDALQERNGARVSEIGEYLDIPNSTAYRHLVTLRQSGYVVKEADEYQLSARFLNLGQSVKRRSKFYNHIENKVDFLSDETGELVQFAVEEQGYGKYLFRGKGEKAVTTDVQLGEPFHLHVTAVGKAMLSQLDRDRVEEILEEVGMPQITADTITDKQQLYDELEEIRETGIAYNNEERISGLRAVATPVTEVNGYLIGAITVAGPKNRMRGERFHSDLPELLSGTVNELEINLKYDID